ncbi:MAG: hypothetical protein AAF357_10970 [Verrucomicrobiota bacterium]
MKLKFLLLALPLLTLFAAAQTAEAGHRYGGGYGYGHSYGHSYGHRSDSFSSRYRAAAFDYNNGGRGHFRDSGHSNYRTYQIFRNYDAKAKKVAPTAVAPKKHFSVGIRSAIKGGRRR